MYMHEFILFSKVRVVLPMLQSRVFLRKISPLSELVEVRKLRLQGTF